MKEKLRSLNLLIRKVLFWSKERTFPIVMGLAVINLGFVIVYKYIYSDLDNHLMHYKVQHQVEGGNDGIVLYYIGKSVDAVFHMLLQVYDSFLFFAGLLTISHLALIVLSSMLLILVAYLSRSKKRIVTKDKYYNLWENHSDAFMAFADKNNLLLWGNQSFKEKFHFTGKEPVSWNEIYAKKFSSVYSSKGKTNLVRLKENPREFFTISERYLKYADKKVKKIIEIYPVDSRMGTDLVQFYNFRLDEAQGTSNITEILKRLHYTFKSAAKLAQTQVKLFDDEVLRSDIDDESISRSLYYLMKGTLTYLKNEPGEKILRITCYREKNKIRINFSVSGVMLTLDDLKQTYIVENNKAFSLEEFLQLSKSYIKEYNGDISLKNINETEVSDRKFLLELIYDERESANTILRNKVEQIKRYGYHEFN